MLRDAGLQPRGEPRGEEQLPLWLLTILRVNTPGSGQTLQAEETEGKLKRRERH